MKIATSHQDSNNWNFFLSLSPFGNWDFCFHDNKINFRSHYVALKTLIEKVAVALKIILKKKRKENQAGKLASFKYHDKRVLCF